MSGKKGSPEAAKSFVKALSSHLDAELLAAHSPQAEVQAVWALHLLGYTEALQEPADVG